MPRNTHMKTMYFDFRSTSEIQFYLMFPQQIYQCDIQKMDMTSVIGIFYSSSSPLQQMDEELCSLQLCSSLTSHTSAWEKSITISYDRWIYIMTKMSYRRLQNKPLDMTASEETKNRPSSHEDPCSSPFSNK